MPAVASIRNLSKIYRKPGTNVEVHALHDVSLDLEEGEFTAIMKNTRPLRVWLVDPSLFTAPYDAGLTEGLLAIRRFSTRRFSGVTRAEPLARSRNSGFEQSRA